MRFRTTRKWQNIKDLESLLFFAQRAEELLFDYTLDSYKPSSLNSVYLCGEAVSLIYDIERGIIDKSNLKPVLDELSWSLSNDDVAKSLLDLDKSEYLLDHEGEKLDRVRLRLEVLGRTLGSFRYLERCKKKLSQAVKDSQKEKIDNYSRLLFTTLINIGVNKKHLHEKTVGFFFSGGAPETIDNVDCIDSYLEEISPLEHDFEVIFLASSLLKDVKDSAEKVFNLKFHKEMPDDLEQLSIRHEFYPEEEEVIAQVGEISAFDCYSAKDLAVSELCQLRDLFTLYHHKNQIKWREEVLIRQCCNDAPRYLDQAVNPIEKVVDQKPKQASESLNWMLKSFRMNPRDFTKFNRAVDFHGLSVNNSDPENQLLNLWIALETIVPSHSGSAKIKQVIESVLPFLGINYHLRLVENITQDLLRWSRRETIKILKEVPAPKGASLRKKVLVLLVHPDAEVSRNTLYGRVRDFHLLRYRMFRLAELLKTPDKALSSLIMHEEKVSWQIRRMYRTRNLIVHSGTAPRYMQSLIENGHDYLDQVIFIITRMSGGEYGVRSIEQAFELAKLGRRKIESSFKGEQEYTDEILRTLLNEHDFI